MKKSALTILASLFAACSSSNPAIPVTDVQQDYADARCANAVECLAAPDVVSCEAAANPIVTTANYATLYADVADGVIKYDVDAFQSCLDEIGVDPCHYFGDVAPPTPDCSKVFTGTIAVGAPCFIADECMSGQCNKTDSTCDPDDTGTTCCPGTCAATPVLASIGEACGGTIACVDTAYCDLAGDSTCKALITIAGSPCMIGQCADPLYCETGLDLDSPDELACGQPAAEGATCVPTAAIPCADVRDYCDGLVDTPTSNTCTPRAKLGGICDPDSLPCEALATCVHGSCVADVAPGAACGTGSDAPACLSGLSCTDGVCAPPTAPAAGPDCH